MGILRTDIVSHSQLTSANASVLFNGGTGSAGDTGLKTADGDNAYTIGTNITIECWIYHQEATTFNTIWATNNYGVSGNAAILYAHNNGLYASITGFASDGDFTNCIETGKWHHIASVKDGSQWRFYVDGEIIGYRETTSAITEDQLTIGASNYGGNYPHWSMHGYISNFRVNKRALYKENFTPSKFKLKNIAGTTLLCCQDASDDTTAAVGSITAGGSPVPGGFGPDLKEDTTDTGVVFTDNTKFDTLSYMVPPGGTTAQRGRGRGFRFGGDSAGGKQNYIEFVNIQSQGTAQDFGDLLTTLTQAHAGSSSIRSIIFAGYNAPANVADIQYITNATQGNSIDAGINVSGDFTRYVNVVSNEVRSVYGGGTPGYTATMEYVTNASLSSVTDFGDFSAGGMYSAATMNSSTRGIFAGGYYNPGGGATQLNTIQYITIMTTGNSQDFGDLVENTGGPHGICSSPIRGIAWANGNAIQYLTIATLGNAIDFGDATVAGFNSGVSFSSHTRGVAGGGYNNPGSGSANQNWIEYVTISTTGNASDFGDLRTVGSSMGGSSDCHGGLS